MIKFPGNRAGRGEPKASRAEAKAARAERKGANARPKVREPGAAWRAPRWAPRFSRRERKARAPAEIVLRPYASPARARSKVTFIILMAVILFAYGYGFSVFAPYEMVPFFVPIALLGILSIWALPELDVAPTKALERMFFITFMSIPLWPNYLAIALPGLPWITFVRLTGFPLTLLLLLCISISRTFRMEIWNALKGAPLLWRGIVFFALYQAFSVVLSNQPQTSIDKLVVTQISWTAVFFVAAYVFSKPGRAERWMFTLWAIAVVIALLAIREHQIGRVLWAGHVPSFIAVQDPNVQRAMSAKMRAGTALYRSQGTFTTPLGLSEFLALTMPFTLHIIATPYKIWLRVAAAISVPFILTAIIDTDSRLGFIGFLLSFVFYLFFWGALRWQKQRGSLWGPAVVLTYPAVMLAFAAAILFVPRLRVMTLGGGKQANSTEARVEQVRLGIPMVLRHPFGHGIARGAEALNYRNSAGVLTIDTYYLLIALDYGIFGFLIFYGTLAIAIGTAFRGFVLGARDREQSILIPLSIALISFFIIKSIYSGVENQSTVFMMLGCIAALAYRVKVDHGLLTPPVTKRPLIRGVRPIA